MTLAPCEERIGIYCEHTSAFCVLYHISRGFDYRTRIDAELLSIKWRRKTIMRHSQSYEVITHMCVLYNISPQPWNWTDVKIVSWPIQRVATSDIVLCFEISVYKLQDLGILSDRWEAQWERLVKLFKIINTRYSKICSAVCTVYSTQTSKLYMKAN